MSTNQTIDANITACDKMYQATFRSDPVRLDSLENWESEIPRLKSELAMFLYPAKTRNEAPTKPITDDEQALDSYYCDLELFECEAIEWLDEHYPEYGIEGHTLVVDLCNYKGEVEGDISLFTMYEKCPVFTSKRDSFFAANN
jgi:hypothetical protein